MFDEKFTRTYKTDEIPQSVYEVFRNHGCYLYCAERNGTILVYLFDEEDGEFTGRIDMVDSTISDITAWARNYQEGLDGAYLIEEIVGYDYYDRDIESYASDLKLTIETVRAIGMELEALAV